MTIRHALRSLGKSPGFALVSIAILALGIGASTAIFSVVHAVLLKPLAYGDSARLVQVQSRHPEQGTSVLAPATFQDLTRQSRSFVALAAQRYDYANLTRAASPARLTGVQATADYFRVFGVAPLLGRTWNADETLAGANPVVVISESLWRTQLGGRPEALDSTLVLDDVPHTVIGVMPARFSDPWGSGQLWRPLPTNGEESANRATRFWSVFARLADGTDLATANAELATLAHAQEQAHGQHYRGWTLVAVDLRSLVVGNYRAGLTVVLGAVLCVLLITCANVAGLSLVRAIGRRKEFAVRAALGASAGRLVRQLLVESLVLAAIGGALGILVAHWGVSAILALVGQGWLPRAGEIELDGAVLGSAVALTLLTGLGFGVAPAWGAGRADASDALKDQSGRGSGGPSARRFRAGLVVAEIALALVLLVGAGLLGRSFLQLVAKNPGVRTSDVLTLGVSLSPKRYDTADKRRSYYARVEEAVMAVPGVAAAGFTQTLPFTWGIPLTLIPVGESNVTEQTVPQAYYDSVSAPFFAATGIPILRGRGFTEADNPQSPPVVVISESTARLYFGAGDPIGRRLRSTTPGSTTQLEIVGVAGDVWRTGLASTEMPFQIYRPLAQRPTDFATLMVRTHLPPETVARQIQEAIWRIDPDQAIGSVATIESLVATSLTQPRLYLALFGMFASLALVLAGVGLYGLVAHGVAQRTREFGIRSALGATALDVTRLVLREGARLAALGLLLGLSGAFAGARLLKEMLHGLPVHDPLVFLCVPLVLAGTTLVACLLPARRAARVDPAVALRSE